VRPVVPPLLFGPVIVVLCVVAFSGLGVAAAFGGLAGGYLAWTLCEYWIHRSLFHLEPRSAAGARLHFIIHGVHHDHPSDPLRLVMPPVVTVPAAGLFAGRFVVVLGTPFAWAVTAGFYGGYLLYDLVHYALHHARPKGRAGRLFHRLHMRHHFEDDTRGFGVSAPWWDVVFGTAPRNGKKTATPPT
jgi:sterol desaturase/sphingolipid hydroxylase (fatty acid hydroxylase superfamily)